MLFVTGGAGFIGSNFVHDWLSRQAEPIINIDKLTYAGNLENIKDIENHANYTFIKGDIVNEDFINDILILKNKKKYN